MGWKDFDLFFSSGDKYHLHSISSNSLGKDPCPALKDRDPTSGSEVLELQQACCREGRVCVCRACAATCLCSRQGTGGVGLLVSLIWLTHLSCFLSRQPQLCALSEVGSFCFLSNVEHYILGVQFFMFNYSFFIFNVESWSA